VAEVPEPAAHLEFAAQQFADPAVARWHWPEHLGGPRTVEQTREILTEQAAQWEAHRLCWWWWRERASRELVGMTGLNRSAVEREPVIEIGWSLPVANQGRGLATEMAAAALAWAFQPRGLDRIVAFTMPENEPSRAVMRRIGMTYVRDFTRKGFRQVLYEARAAS
jgi:RimJ/RimL family protein N-acetyltransferase